MEIDIRPIQLSDTASFRQAVGSVAREKRFLMTTDAFSLERTTEFVSKNIDNNYAQYVAISDGEVVGWADIVPKSCPSEKHCGGLGMGIIAPYRGQGLGDRLLANAIRHSWDIGLTRLQLGVFDDNHRAMALYHKHGFQHEGTMRHAALIDGNYRDIHLMAQYRV